MMKRRGRAALWAAAAVAGGMLAAGLAAPAHAVGAGDASYYVRIDGRCGGAMVDAQWVITTKECAPAGDAAGLTLVAGWGGSGSTVKLEGLTSHHAPKGDVALIQVKTSASVTTVPLSQRLLTDGDRFIVSKGSAGRVTQAEFEVGSPEYAYDYLARSRVGESTCDGDGGGPAVVRTTAGDRLAGLVRFSYNPCGAFATSAFSKLAAPATWDWMMSTITALHTEGRYVIVNRNSGKALDVNDDGEVVQRARTDSGRQTWRIAADGRATSFPRGFPVTVTNVASGKLLGVVGGDTGDGARAVSSPRTGSPIRCGASSRHRTAPTRS